MSYTFVASPGYHRCNDAEDVSPNTEVALLNKQVIFRSTDGGDGSRRQRPNYFHCRRPETSFAL